MKIVCNPTTPLSDQTSVTLGAFDGLHRGHMSLIYEARKDPCSSAVFSFSQNPDFIMGKQTERYITSPRLREILIAEAGIDFLILQDFDVAFRNLSSDEFFYKYIVEILKAKKVTVGADFQFGQGGKGNASFLAPKCLEHDIELAVMPPVQDNDKTISSRNIRDLITAGDLLCAERQLGRPFCVCGKIVHGTRLGHILGIKTANLPIDSNQVMPPQGVYSTIAEIHGKKYSAVTNYGGKPTVSQNLPGIETHILDFDQEIYGEEIIIYFKSMIRPIKRHKDLQDLADTIRNDIENVRKNN